MKQKEIFHAGCLPCESQERNSVATCFGCQYFDGNWSLPDLSIKPESLKNKTPEDTIKRELEQQKSRIRYRIESLKGLNKKREIIVREIENGNADKSILEEFIEKNHNIMNNRIG